MGSLIYHLKPELLVGDVLQPLNKMDPKSDIYRQAVQKYQNRPKLLVRKIPILDCLWNDVVQFSAIDPQILFRHMKHLNPNFAPTRTHVYYADINMLAQKYDMVIYQQKKREKGDYRLDLDEIIPIANYTELHEPPAETIAYWKRAIRENSPPLLFPFVPHILIKATISVSDLQIKEIEI